MLSIYLFQWNGYPDCKQVLSKYPQSFSKDLSIVDHSLQKSSLPITGDLRLVGDSKIVDQYVDIVNPNSTTGYSKLTTEIEAGKVEKVVIINTYQDKNSIQPFSF